MLEALVEGPPRRPSIWDDNAGALWEMNGGGWWDARMPGHGAQPWIDVLSVLPYCATVETRNGPVGLVHAAPVHGRWQDLEDGIRDEGGHGHQTRLRALWSRVRHGHVRREIGETGREHLGRVEGIRAVVTGHTPVSEPSWHENVLGIDTGVHIGERGDGQLTVARIDGNAFETLSFDRVTEDASGDAG